MLLKALHPSVLITCPVAPQRHMGNISRHQSYLPLSQWNCVLSCNCIDWFRPASGSSGKRLQLSYPVHLLWGIPDQIRTRGGSLSHLHPTNRRSTWPPIQSLIGRHLYTRMITVVVGELCQGQVLISATLEVQDACSQHVLQNLDSPL